MRQQIRLRLSRGAIPQCEKKRKMILKQIVEALREKPLRIAEIRVTVLEANRRGTKRKAVKHRRKKGKGS